MKPLKKIKIKKAQVKKFGNAMKTNKDELYILKLRYLAAQLKEQELKELFASTYNKVLEEHIYTVAPDKNPERYNMKTGDRITGDDSSYLMSDADYEQYLKYAQEKQFAYGYIDEKGYYKPGYDGSEIRLNAENALIDFQISIFPEKLKEAFKDIKKNYTQKQKFLDIVMGTNL